MIRVPSNHACVRRRCDNDPRCVALAEHAVHLFGAKVPGVGKGRWNDYDLMATISADPAFRPMSEGGCTY